MKGIDNAILRWHQDLVDFLQRQPVQLARVCAAVYTVCLFMLWFMRVPPDGLSWVRLVFMSLDVIAVTCIWLGALSARLLAVAGSGAFFIRCVLLICLSLDMLIATLAPGLDNVAAILRDVSVLMYFYFAECRPPKPKTPVHKLNPAFSTGQG